MRLPLVLAALSLLPAAASAQTYAPRERVISERVVVERRAPATIVAQPGLARVCVPWCSADTSPCDPPVYKQADGRCSWENQ